MGTSTAGAGITQPDFVPVTKTTVVEPVIEKICHHNLDIFTMLKIYLVFA